MSRARAGQLRHRIQTAQSDRLLPSVRDVLSEPQIAGILAEASINAIADLDALSGRDPAAPGPESVLESYRCFDAVLSYRLANRLLAEHGLVERQSGVPAAARAIAEAAKVRSGVDIHPRATIGPRFVVDHGVGTVIGETCEIGADCYVLQGVILGARAIANNPTGKRHPTLGDSVEVGGFARVLGPVTIGRECVVEPHAVVTESVPPRHRVRVLTRCQHVRAPVEEPAKGRTLTITGVLLCREHLSFYGSGLQGALVDVLDDHGHWRELPDPIDDQDRTVAVRWRSAGRGPFTHARLRSPSSEVVYVGLEAWSRQSALPCPRCPMDERPDR